MALRNTYSDYFTKLQTSNMQSAMVSNRFILGIVAFGVSFGISLVLSWDFNKAFLTAFITLPATYLAAFFIDKRRRKYQLLVLESLHGRIREMEGLKSRIVGEINQLESHRAVLYAESSQLQNQVTERRSQRDNLNRELNFFHNEKKQLEVQINYLETEIQNLDKSKVELNNSFSTLTAEKRRLDLNCNVSRSEINQLQTQIYHILEEKQELENNLTLLENLKPQLEERANALWDEIQELENQQSLQNQLLVDKATEKENIEATLNYLQTQIAQQQTELQQLQNQTSLLQSERDTLQSQVWELLQQIETLSQETLHDTQEEIDLFPFADLIENEADTEEIPEEWNEFLKQLPSYELQVLKAIAEQDNPLAAIKEIAEANITMPNLLIDSINERANDTIGDLIIDTHSQLPQIYQEHLTDVQKIIAMYQDFIGKIH